MYYLVCSITLGHLQMYRNEISEYQIQNSNQNIQFLLRWFHFDQKFFLKNRWQRVYLYSHLSSIRYTHSLIPNNLSQNTRSKFQSLSYFVISGKYNRKQILQKKYIHFHKNSQQKNKSRSLDNKMKKQAQKIKYTQLEQHPLELQFAKTNLSHYLSHYFQILQIMTKNKYNPLQVPPDWGLSDKHMRSTRLGMERSISQSDPRYLLCPCCSSYIDKFPLPYFQCDKQLCILGESIPLLYNALKFSCGMLILLILDASVLSSIINYVSNPCFDSSKCANNIFNRLAYISDSEDTIIYRKVLRFCGFIGQMIILLYFRDSQVSITNNFQQKLPGISNYSIFVSGIPRFYGCNQDKIRNIFSRNITNSDVAKTESFKSNIFTFSENIKQIMLIYDLKEYYNLQNQLKNMAVQKINYNRKQDTFNLIIVDKVEKSIHTRIDGLIKNMAERQQNYFSGKAFIIFNKKEQRDRSIQYFEDYNTQRDSLIKENYPSYDPVEEPIRARIGLQPTQIIWQNQHLSKIQIFISIIWGWSVGIFILVSTAIGIYYLVQYKDGILINGQQTVQISIVMNLLIPIVIIGINKFVLKPILYYATNTIQKHTKHSSLQTSFILKSSILSFFNTSLLLLVVEGVFNNNYTREAGLVSEQTLIIAINALLLSLVTIINFPYLWYCIKKCIYSGSANMTQQQANKLLTYPQYVIGFRYLNIIVTLWTTFFYSELIPVASLLSMFGLVFYYLADKYILLRRSSVPYYIDSSLSKVASHLIQFTIILKPLGQFLFQYKLREGKLKLQSLVMIILGIVFLIIPKNQILSCCRKAASYVQVHSYDEVQQELKDTYSLYYPPRMFQRHNGKKNQRRFFVDAEQQNPRKSKQYKLQTQQYNSPHQQESVISRINEDTLKDCVYRQQSEDPKYEQSEQSDSNP